MANIASARKRARQEVQRNAHNTSLRSRLRTAIKSVRKAVAAGDKPAAARVPRVEERHRLDRRQAHRPQERRRAPQEPPGRCHQGPGLPRLRRA